MNISRFITRLGTFTAIAAALTLGGGCSKSGSSSGGSGKGSQASAEKNSFQEVTSHLDAGGNLYMYVSTEAWLQGLSAKVGDWRGLAHAIPDMDADTQEKVMHGFDVVTNLIKDCGMEEVSGVGMSSIAREPGYYHNAFVLHHYPGKDSGFIWAMFGKNPHALDGLDLLPASTVAATFSDMDLPLLMSSVQKSVEEAGIPQASDALKNFPDMFAQTTGLKLNDVLASLGGEYGFVLTASETKKVKLPLPGGEIEIPEPRIMFVIKVKNDLIYDRIDAALKGVPQLNSQVQRPKEEGGLKMMVVSVPLPLQISVRLTVARSGDYLFLASNDALVQEALGVKAGKMAGLKSTDEFKKLAQGIPERGNHFSFVSRKFGEIFGQIQSQAVQTSSANMPAGQAELMKKVMSLNSASKYGYSVSVNGDEGWVVTANGSQDGSKMLLMPAVAGAGVAAGVALPAMAKAKARAQAAAAAAGK